MKTYQRYLLSPLYLFLPLMLVALSGIYFLVEFFERLEDVLVARAPVSVFLLYLAYRLPEILMQVWPPALGLAALASLAMLSRGQELLALRTLGFSPSRIVAPYLAAGFLLSLAVSGFLALSLPGASYRALYTWEVRIKGHRPQTVLSSGRLFFAGPDFLLSATPLEPRGEYLADFFYLKKGRTGPRAYLYARKARYLKRNRWLLEEGIYAERTGRFTPRVFRKKIFHIPFSPEVLLSVKQPLKTLSLRALRERYRFLRESGLSPAEPVSEILFRLFYPLIGVLVLAPALAVFLSFRGKRALAKGLSTGLAAVILTYAWFLGIKVLSAGGRIPPEIAYFPGLVFPAAFAILVLKRYAY